MVGEATANSTDALERAPMKKHQYFWTSKEEKELIKLWNEDFKDPELLAVHLDRKPEAIKKKLSRLGLVVGPRKKIKTTTSDLEIPEELPTVEEALKVLAAAMKRLQEPGLDRTEVMRLRSIVSTVKTYQALFADYVDYRTLEKELVRITAAFKEAVAQLREYAKGTKAKMIPVALRFRNLCGRAFQRTSSVKRRRVKRKT